MKAVDSLFRGLLFLLVFLMSSQWGTPFPPVGKAFLYVSYADLILAATFGVWILTVLIRRNFGEIRWPPVPFWIFLSLVFVCTALAAKKSVAVKEAIQAVEYFFVAALLFMNGFRNEKDWQLAFKVLVASIACNVLLGVWQYFSADNAYKIAGAFSNKNVFGAWLALVLPFMLGLACYEKCSICRYGMVLLILPAMYVDMSAGSLIALAVSTTVIAAVQCRAGLAKAVVAWALIFAVGPQLLVRGGHRDVLQSSIAPFVVSNYSFTAESANRQAQVVYNETGYDSARDFLSIYENLYPGHAALKDDARLTESDVYDWSELFTQLKEESEDGGTAQTIWKDIPEEIKSSAAAGLKKMEEDDDYEYMPKGHQRELIIGIINSRFEGKSAEEAMKLRLELADEFDFSIRPPVRLRMAMAIDKANAGLGRRINSIGEELKLTREKHKDLEEGELPGIVEEHISDLESKRLVFQLTEQPNPVPNTRYIRWHSAWKMIRSNRLFGLVGAGPGHFRDSVNQHFEPGGPLQTPNAEGRAGAADTWALTSDEPDSFNQYLVLAGELGFLGLFSFIWMMAAGIGECVRGLSQSDVARKAVAVGGIGAMTGVLMVSVFHPVLVRGLGVVFVFVLCAIWSFGTDSSEVTAAVPSAESDEGEEMDSEASPKAEAEETE